MSVYMRVCKRETMPFPSYDTYTGGGREWVCSSANFSADDYSPDPACFASYFKNLFFFSLLPLSPLLIFVFCSSADQSGSIDRFRALLRRLGPLRLDSDTFSSIRYTTLLWQSTEENDDGTFSFRSQLPTHFLPYREFSIADILNQPDSWR